MHELLLKFILLPSIIMYNHKNTHTYSYHNLTVNPGSENR